MEVEISGAESSHTRYDGLASLDEGVQMTAAELLLDAEFKLDMQLLQEQQRQRLQQANLEQLTASQAPASQYVRTQATGSMDEVLDRSWRDPREETTSSQEDISTNPNPSTPSLHGNHHLNSSSTNHLHHDSSSTLSSPPNTSTPPRPPRPHQPPPDACRPPPLTHGTRRACSTRQPPGNPRHPPSRLPRGSRGGSRFSDAGAGSGVAEAAVAVAVQVSWVGEAVDKARVAMAEVGKAHRSAAEEAAIEFDGLLGGDLMQGQWGASWGAEEWGTEGSMTSA
ncbi:MAG: hypothetical protein WDW38_001619 [Sanguina aurantia]